MQERPDLGSFIVGGKMRRHTAFHNDVSTACQPPARNVFLEKKKDVALQTRSRSGDGQGLYTSVHSFSIYRLRIAQPSTAQHRTVQYSARSNVA